MSFAPTDHPDSEVQAALIRLCAAVCSWERATGRSSMLIYRENNGEMPGEPMRQPGFTFRADSGKPIDMSMGDLSDQDLLRPYTLNT